MKRLICVSILSLMALAGLTNCASVQEDLSQPDQIFIESNPANAIVQMNNDTVGMTPMKLEVPRSSLLHTIKIIKEGYRTEEFVLVPKAEESNITNRTRIINSTILFGTAGLAGGFFADEAPKGLIGGALLGLVVGELQAKDTTVIRYEYSPKQIRVSLVPILDK